MRKCSLCLAEDRPELIEDAICNCHGGDVMGHSADCQRIEHYVQKDIILHSVPLTKKLKDKGWTERQQGFRGKPAIERLICIPCAAKQDEIDEMIAFRKKKVEEMDPNKVQTMYQILCS